MRRRMVRSSSGIEDCSDRQLILNRFQEGLTEVTNAEHVEGTTIEEGQQKSK